MLSTNLSPKSLRALVATLSLAGVMLTGPTTMAQNAAKAAPPPKPPKPTGKMLYHGGPVMHSFPEVWLIWYGCWSESCGVPGATAATGILADFTSSLSATPYFVINTTYPDTSGLGPTGGLFYSGSAFEPTYSHGVELTDADLQGIVIDQLAANHVPESPSAIYVVLGAPGVGSAATGFCTPHASPHHGVSEFHGSAIWYAFIGNPTRCPATAAPQFVGPKGKLLPTPNANLAADGMASSLAAVLNAIVTNPYVNGGWYDANGFENADQCMGQFGPTYVTANGARANVRWDGRDYLLQQNWVNVGKGRCAMQL